MIIDSTIDQIIIIIYVISIFSISLYYSASSQTSSENYFFADGKISSVIIGLNFFISNAFVIFVTLAFKISYLLIIGSTLLISFIFFTYYKREKRPLRKNVEYFYNSKHLSISGNSVVFNLSLLILILTKITTLLFVTCFIFRYLLGWNPATSTIIIILLTGIYTIVGGTPSIIRTQVFQSIITLVGAAIILLSGIEFMDMPWQDDITDYITRFLSSEFSSVNIMISILIFLLWYSFINRLTINRISRTKSGTEAKKGIIIGIFLILIVILSFTFKETNQASKFPLNGTSILINSISPGYRGLLIAAIISFLMSLFSNFLINTASLLTLDVYKKFQHKISEHKLVFIGRLTATFLVFILILCIPFVQMLDMLTFLKIITIPVYICSPFLAFFLFSMRYRGTKPVEIFVSLLACYFIGFVRIVNEFWPLANIISWRWLIESSVPDFVLIQFIATIILLFAANRFLSFYTIKINN